VAGVTKKMLHDRRGNSRESAASSTLSPSPRSGRFTRRAQHGDLMQEREDLDLLGPVTAPEQDQELKDTAEDQVQHRPEHEQRSCPLREQAQAMTPPLNSIDPGFRTPQARHGSLRKQAQATAIPVAGRMGSAARA
jgi:hypothetical protein